MPEKNRTYLLALLPFALIVVLFELIPLVMVVTRSFLSPEGGLTFQNYLDIFDKKLYRDTIVNSVKISAASSLAGLVIAFFGGNALHSSDSKARAFFMSILNMTSNFAGVPLAFSFIILLGNAGVMVALGKHLGISALADFNLYSYTGLLMTYIYFQIPLATLLLAPAFEGLKKEWQEAVELMGGSRRLYWFKVGLPNLLPSLLGTLSILFSNAIAAYATAYALLSSNYSLLPIRIAEQFVGEVEQRAEFGSALAVVLMLLMMAMLLLNNAMLRKRKRA